MPRVKMVSALTPDDVKEMKAVGCEDDLKLDSLSCNRASGMLPHSSVPLTSALHESLDWGL